MVYARFRRTRKCSGAYGRKRTYTRRRRTVGFKKVLRPRFAMSGYRKNIEKKYFDKTYQSDTNETPTGNDVGSVFNNGVTFISNTWGEYAFGAQKAPQMVSNDMLKGVGTGTTAKTRIGNKVKVKYVKGSFTFNAALLDTGVLRTQGGEALANVVGGANKRWEYLRTSYRMVIVKDLQVNSTDTFIRWHQVFDTNNSVGGIHSELNVDNMGRFIVLEDKTFTLDSDTPQKTIKRPMLSTLSSE